MAIDMLLLAPDTPGGRLDSLLGFIVGGVAIVVGQWLAFFVLGMLGQFGQWLGPISLIVALVAWIAGVNWWPIPA